MASLHHVLFLIYETAQQSARLDAFDMQLNRLIGTFGAVSTSISDMTSCRQCNCLYLADSDNKIIIKYVVSITENAGRTVVKTVVKLTKSTWSVDNEPKSLSVNAAFNVIVVFKNVNTASEYTSDGELVRDLTPQLGRYNLEQMFEMDSERFLVHKFNDSVLESQMCIVNKGGEDLECIHVSWHRSAVTNHIATNGFIFVADYSYSRVMMFTSTLKHVRNFVNIYMGTPPKLVLCEDSNLLLVTGINQISSVSL